MRVGKTPFDTLSNSRPLKLHLSGQLNFKSRHVHTSFIEKQKAYCTAGDVASQSLIQIQPDRERESATAGWGGEGGNTHTRKVVESKTRKILRPPVAAGSGLYLHSEREIENTDRSVFLSVFDVDWTVPHEQRYYVFEFKIGKRDYEQLLTANIQAVRLKSH